MIRLFTVITLVLLTQEQIRTRPKVVTEEGIERIQVFGKIYLVDGKTGKEKDAFFIQIKDSNAYVLDLSKDDFARRLIEALVCSYNHKVWELVKVRAAGALKDRVILVDQLEVVLPKEINLMVGNKTLQEKTKKYIKFVK